MNNITDSWNGTNLNGDKCTEGVSFYTYQAKAENGTELSGQGTVHLIAEE